MAEDAPNFLFLFPDQWRWDWVGYCGGSGGVTVRTPNVDRLAAGGMRFGECRTNSPLCAPARAALATGLRPHRTGVPTNGYDLSAEAQTVFQLLRAAGYRTATCGKNDLQKHGAQKGLEGWTRRQGQYGFTDAINQSGKWDAVNTGWPTPSDPYMAELHRAGLAKVHRDDYTRRKDARRERGRTDASPTPLPRPMYTDDFCGRSALRLLERMPAEAPWFLWVNFPGPHEPFDPPAELLRGYEGVEYPRPIGVGAEETGEDHQAIRRAYAAMIEGIDQWVGRLCDAVRARGEWERTVVVFCADHGELLGDHGRWSKSLWYEGSVHVPLVVAGPGVRTGASGALVELIDLAPTFLEMAGLRVPEEWDARSLGPVLRGERSDAEHRAVQTSELQNWRMLFDGRYKLVEREDGSALLYDLQADPMELRDLAGAQGERVESMRRRLAAELGR